MVISTMTPTASATLQACPADVREYLHKARDGGELTFEEGLRLATAEGPALHALVAFADHLRRETVGETITYVVNRNINFTNVCFVGCSFCGFGRGPAAPDAYSLSFEEVVRRARDGAVYQDRLPSMTGQPVLVPRHDLVTIRIGSERGLVVGAGLDGAGGGDPFARGQHHG